MSSPSTEQVTAVESLLGEVFGHPGEDRWIARQDAAREVATTAISALQMQRSQLVYGELDVECVARLLAAAEVRDGDVFLDIGSGDGMPTLAAALLYPRALQICRGIEIVPALWERSRTHAAWLAQRCSVDDAPPVAPVEFLQGDVHTVTDDSANDLRAVVRETTLALCFATTWSKGAARRELPRLSAALGAVMQPGARVIVVDGRLLPSEHEWTWEGDLRITTPDTAPCSIASLYERRG